MGPYFNDSDHQTASSMFLRNRLRLNADYLSL